MIRGPFVPVVHGASIGPVQRVIYPRDSQKPSVSLISKSKHCLSRPHWDSLPHPNCLERDFLVIAGLDPAIHPASQKLLAKQMDPRVTSASTRVSTRFCPRVTS